MAVCNVTEIAFNDLWSKGVLKEGKTRIEDPIRFDVLNKLYSDVARAKFGVTNDGLLFDINTQTTATLGPLNLYSHKGESTFENQFAVLNTIFANEFQTKFDKANKLEPEILTPAPIIPALTKKYNSLKESIDMGDYPAEIKAKLMNELNDCRTTQDFGELMKKLC